MTSVKQPAPPAHGRPGPRGDGASADEADDMPYHAREYARPFSYGNLPPGFRTSDLKHVVVQEETSHQETRSFKERPQPASPATARKAIRPSISPSRPVLRKTPTRQEFEEMLMERREQALREPSTLAIQQAQNAAIQKDLDELQQILSESISMRPQQVEGAGAETASESLRAQTPPAPASGEVTQAVVRYTSSDDEFQSASYPAGRRGRRTNSQSSQQERAGAATDLRRPETPAFPAVPKRPLDERCVSPYPSVTPGTPSLQRIHSSGAASTPAAPTAKSDQRGGAGGVGEPHDVAAHLVKFAKDYSEFWYKPHLSREEAIALLRNAAPGTFLVRNSTTYRNAFGLVVRVDRPPQGLALAGSAGSAGSAGGAGGEELVRHFLVEPTARGVRLKGCPHEPVFTSLSALVYQHSINRMALPYRLTIPDRDPLLAAANAELAAAQKQLLLQGAACNVLYLFSCGMESLTGDEAIRKAVGEMFSRRPPPAPTEVHLKVSQQGVTLTDNTRRVFFRRHYAPHSISHFGVDPEQRFWRVAADDEGLRRTVNKTIFGFVARPLAGSSDNECHVFCDMAASQPAAAIASFANKVVPMDKSNHRML